MSSRAFSVLSARANPASGGDRERGLLAYVRLELEGGLVCDGLTVRRRAGDGGLYLAFPARTDSMGARHPILRPTDEAARRAIQAEVFRALGLGEGRE